MLQSKIFQHKIQRTGIIFLISMLGGCLNLFAAGTMRSISAMEMVQDMKIGWNLGNTLDAPSGETTWGNPKTTKAMIDEIKKMGFKTVRIPTTWDKHLGASPNYTIDNAWLDRVEEVVNYVLADSMYAILNTHHDDWVTLTAGSQTQVSDKIVKVWAQIANRFKDYSDYLVFETLNEPRLIGDASEWNGGTKEARAILNTYNAAIVAEIRKSGGNNTLRNIMIPTTAATALAVAQNDLVLPAGDTKIIVSQHTYWPYGFSMATDQYATSTWGSATDKSDCDKELDRIATKFVKQGIPVIIGEWGSINRNNTSARAVHAEYYAQAVRKRGMLPVWWDNGSNTNGNFGLLNRKASPLSWYYPEIAQALVKGAIAGTSSIKASSKTVANLQNGLVENAGVIHYSLPHATTVSLQLYNVQGKNIVSLVKSVQTLGNYEVKLSNKNIPTGNYILELKTDNSLMTKRITVMK